MTEEDKPDKGEKVQKVKLVGTLHRLQQTTGLARDILLLIFILVLIGGILFLVKSASQIRLPF